MFIGHLFLPIHIQHLILLVLVPNVYTKSIEVGAEEAEGEDSFAHHSTCTIKGSGHCTTHEDQTALLQTSLQVKSRNDLLRQSTSSDTNPVWLQFLHYDDQYDPDNSHATKASSQLPEAFNSETTDRHHDHCSKLLTSTDTDTLTKCSCNQTSIVKLHQGETCPSTCPFTQGIIGEPCFKLCVWGDACPDFHAARKFASTRVMECVPTCGKNETDHIPGCIECADFGKCAVCTDGFLLSEDGTRCDVQMSFGMKAFWGGLFFIVAIVALFLFCLTCCDSKVNVLNYQHAQGFMRRCLPSFIDDSSGRPVWSSRRVWKTNVLTEPVNGLGTMLMFRFLVFVTLCSLLLTFVVGITIDSSTYEKRVEKAANTADCPLLPSEINASLPSEINASFLDHSPHGVNPSSILRRIGNVGLVKTQLTKTNHTEPQDLRQDWHEGKSGAGRGQNTEPHDVMHLAKHNLSATTHVPHVPHPSSHILSWSDYNQDVDPLAIAGYLRTELNLVDLTGLDLNDNSIQGIELDLNKDPSPPDKSVPGMIDAAKVREKTDHAAEMDTKSLTRLRCRMFWVLGALYIVFLVSSWRFGWHILKTSLEYDDQNSSMKDFSLCIEGLPPDFREPEKLEEYLKSYFSCTVIGISIAFDYSDYADLVDVAIDDWLLQVETERPLLSADAEPETRTSSAAEDPSKKVTSRRMSSSLFKVDSLLLGASGDELKTLGTLTGEQKAEVVKMCQEIECSGKAYAVLKTQTGVTSILATAKMSTPLFSYNGAQYKLTLDEVWSEPEDIKWEYHVKSKHQWRIPVGILICLATMVLYLTSLIPLVKVYINMAMVPGVQVSTLNELLLGVLPAIGGAVMCLAVDQVSEWIGYHERDRRDVIVGFGAFVLTCVTVVGDLYLTLQIAQGSSLDDAFNGSPVPFDRILADELFACVIPSYIICVAIAPTLAETFIPLFLFGYLVKNRPLPRRTSEKFMKVTPFETCYRYSDTLSGMCAMWTILFFLSPLSWKTLLGCSIMIVLQFLFSTWQMLRFYCRQTCNFDRLAWHGLHWWSVPLCMLFAACLMYGVQGGLLPWGTARFGFPIHFAIYCLGLKMVKDKIPQPISRDDTYTEVVTELASKGDYATMFNTNPIHCLRLRHLGKSKKCDIVPWTVGKEHLQQGAPKYVTKPVGFFSELLGRSA